MLAVASWHDGTADRADTTSMVVRAGVPASAPLPGDRTGSTGLLLTAALLALGWANSPWSGAYWGAITAAGACL